MTFTTFYDTQHDFEPLTKFLTREPNLSALPWEYMGQDNRGNFHYRERENSSRLKVNKNGRLTAIHTFDGLAVHTTACPCPCGFCTCGDPVAGKGQ
jgi:hypothetical protein